ncbi:hypothetical protein BAE44_0004744, partial [Dichanthelium oligosanthes]
LLGVRFFRAGTQRKQRPLPVLKGSNWHLVGLINIFYLESDCARVVEKLKAKQQDRSLVWPLIKEVLEESRHFHRFEVHKIGREQNPVAHELAHLAIRSRESRVYFASFTKDVTLICNDIT